jgi:CheY-like chemotaxis protein
MARILLIDDDDAVREALRLTLTHLGHDVTMARDGAEGLELFEKTKPDLLITDIVMPVKEGIEVLLELRSRKAPVKIIAISGGGRVNARQYLAMAKLLGAAQVLEKPFTREELTQALRASLADPVAPVAAIPA